MLRHIALYIGTLTLFMSFAIGVSQSIREFRKAFPKKKEVEKVNDEEVA